MIEDTFQTVDFSTIIEDFSISDNGQPPKPYRQRGFTPRIRSNVLAARPNTLRSNMFVYENRNFCASKEAWNPNDPGAVDRIFEHWKKTYIDEGAYAEICGDPISVNTVSLGEWVKSRTPMAAKAMELSLSIPDLPVDKMDSFKLMVKGDLKPKLDDTCLSDLPSGQNIVYHDRKVCACFSSCFIEITKRLKAILTKRAKLYVGVNLEEFALDIANTLERDVSTYKCAEIDISKYDKSQNDFTKAFELKVYEYLGMPQEMLELWATSEFNGVAKMMGNIFTVDMNSQRRTGTANTWIGNTLVNMMLLNEAADVAEYSLCCFAGDDSLLLYDRLPNVDLSRYSVAFGFDAKYYEFATPYFCSKFLVSHSGRLSYVPDPLKIFIKFGVEGACSKTLMREKWVSFNDITQAFDSEEVCCRLAALCEEKYGPSPWWYAAIATIHCIRANPQQFERCWSVISSPSINEAKKRSKVVSEGGPASCTNDQFIF
uniref:RdRp n=2 Tax=Manihot esculenta associated ampelovirus 1 TaxID=2843331 RepID=A0A8F1NMF0_9CLOS|nr:RdRp [Manihot esculenta associated ampelovirus 1]QWQ59699.1 RdRp [Manihot esculenta associated ampelovirus 1]